jgi:hypothetical protein
LIIKNKKTFGFLIFLSVLFILIFSTIIDIEDYTNLLFIPVIIIITLVLVYSLESGEIYSKWGIYTGNWFIKRDEHPTAFWGYFLLYLMILILVIIAFIYYIFLELV